MRFVRFVLPAMAAIWLACQVPLSAKDLLPADRPIEEVIDFYIEQRLAARDVLPAPQAEPANLLRRLTLDLTGRIPTTWEVQRYLESEGTDRRAEWVDRLMDSPSFVRHQASEFDVMLMNSAGGSIRGYLQTAFSENRPWDRIFRELILAPESPEEQPESVQFLRRRLKDAEQLTNDVSVLFFGINISCAKCHDHPLVVDWKQDHFYGMLSFFNRTFENGDFVGERDYGNVKFETTEGEKRDGQLMFLSGAVLDEPESKEPSDEEKKQEKATLEEHKKNKTPPPAPAFSRRAQLVDVALRDEESEFFARAIANRLFYRFFGQGLVMPVDQLHSENPASHPQLLAWLARDLQTHGYDLRRLVRGIVMSQAYSRSSVWDSSARPDADLFAVGQVRPLMPQQLGMALRVATNAPQFNADMSPEDFEKRLADQDNAARGIAAQIEVPGESFQVSVSEALLFSNNDRIVREYLGDGGGQIVGQMKDLEQPVEAVTAAVQAILSRQPSDEELGLLVEHLASREDRRVEACQQIVWALLTGPEFRFNH